MQDGRQLRRAVQGEVGKSSGSGIKPSSALDSRLTAALDSRSKRGMLRSLDSVPPPTTLSSSLSYPSPPFLPSPSSPSKSEPPLVDFSSNDYLSFSSHLTLRTNLLRALTSPSFPLYGPPSSRLLDGNTPLHLSLESRFATFFRAPAALLFNSGFDANAGLWACLPGERDWVVFDELVHASMHDGMRASRVPAAKRKAFRHNDVNGLREVLEQILRDDERVEKGDVSVWIGVESLYSMDGDLAPLKDMVNLVDALLPEGNGHFVVDEAHSVGLYGPSGRGLVCALGLEEKIAVRVHTCGKAMACSGAAVLTSPLLRSYLTNYARPLIYSTTLTHVSLAMVSESLGMLERGEGEQSAARTHTLARLFISSLTSLLPPPPTTSSPRPSPVSLPPHLLPTLYPPSLTSPPPPHPPTSPIIPLITSTPRPLAAFLRSHGFLVRPITYPTVPRGMERVRVCLHAANTEEEVRALAEWVGEWARKERDAEEGKAKL
ncbi:hypothetical protein JCM11251_000900 [Rhodosporidiobolus azoricus]